MSPDASSSWSILGLYRCGGEQHSAHDVKQARSLSANTVLGYCSIDLRGYPPVSEVNRVFTMDELSKTMKRLSTLNLVGLTVRLVINRT